MPSWREQWLHRLTGAAQSEQHIFDALAAIVREVGFDYCSFGLHVPPIGRIGNDLWFTTYPREWQLRYFANDYLAIDPVLKCALSSPAPVVWSDSAFGVQRDFWEEARAHGVRCGWTMAMHGRYGETGLISIARQDPQLDGAELDAIEGKLVWLAHTANSAIENAFATRELQPIAEELTAREREVLRWTAAGKTSCEIGIILGISARTVNFHITSILAKLHAVNKTQAVVKALLFDLLH